MKLQSKVLLILSSIWIATCILIFLDSKFILESNYLSQEISLDYKDLNRVQNAIINKQAALELYTNSWSQWDEAYRFMVTKDKKFTTDNYVPGTFTSSGINFFMFFNNEGKLYSGAAYDLTQNKFMPIPAGLLTYLDQHEGFVIHHDIVSRRAGFLKTTDGIILMSSLPVLTADGKGPIHGSLLLGYYLNESFFSDLSKTVEMKLAFFPLPLKNPDQHMQQSLNKVLHGSKSCYLDLHNNHVALGYILVKDIDNHPIGLMQIQLPRTLYKEGVTTLYHYLGIVLLLAIAISATLWYLLKIMVLNRILRVSAQVIDINTRGSFDKRVSISGDDELNEMTRSLNSMLELIELTQEQLKYRITRRTKELEKLSALNRNLFGEIGKQKSIESKLREDEKLLKQMAYYDTLTELPNRAFFNELLQNSITHAERDKYKIAVIFIDVDKFKKINDTYGHDFGDKFLKTVAQRLKHSIKSTDVAARLAGDEFIAFLTNIQGKDMIDKAVGHIFKTLDTPISIDHITVTPRFSMGISIYPDDAKSVEELQNQADLAMYYAKKREGNTFFYYGAIETRTEKPPY